MSRKIHRCNHILGLILILLALTSCAGRPLLGEVALSAPELRPTGAGETVSIRYAVGRPARVSVYLLDGAGAR
ncbi:MAG TPA: hypothetical protein VNL77_04680, partial [Roseiflexaceae bacterium]|nr:hypothetical protein [Roseiflexaceae bacterium]